MTTEEPIIEYFRSSAEKWIELLTELTSYDTPTNHELLVGAFVAHYRQLLEDVGLHCEEIPGTAGPQLIAEKRPAHETSPPIVLVGHSDTVWPVGEVEKRPPRVEGEKLVAPGVYDMRGGLCLIVAFLHYLRDHSVDLPCRLQVYVTADEELGSITSKPHMKRLFPTNTTALILEPPTREGNLKGTRKGVGMYKLEAYGTESHAGADPDRGASAVHEIARQILEVENYADSSREITVNVGQVQGGTANNVVAGHATAGVDVRFKRQEDGDRIDRSFQDLRPKDSRIQLQVSGGIIFPPLEATPRNQKLCQAAVDAAKSVGLDIGIGKTGGGSDGSFLSSLGLGVIDGLGIDGDGAHSINEHVVMDRLPIRAAALTRLVLELARNPIE